MLKKLNNAGDTIVEVMIALAIMGATLAGAVFLANYSLGTIQESHFRSDAILIAQTQLNELKSQVSANPNFISSSQNASTVSELSTIANQYPQINVDTVMLLCNPTSSGYNQGQNCNTYFNNVVSNEPEKHFLIQKIKNLFQQKSNILLNSFCMVETSIVWGSSGCYFNQSGGISSSNNQPNFLVSITSLGSNRFSLWNQVQIEVSWQGRNTSSYTNKVDLYYGFNNTP